MLALASLPALGNFAGGAVAEVVDISPRTLSLALHVALGILLAVVGIELVPEAFKETPRWVPILALVTGGASFHFIDRAAATWPKRAQAAAPATLARARSFSP